MSETTNGFTFYRKLYDMQPQERHSLEAFGLTYPSVFETAVSDPRSVLVQVGNEAVPILTPLVNLPDRNLALYSNRAEQANGEPIGDMYYYSHLEPGLVDEFVLKAMERVIRPLATTSGVLAYDCATVDAERTDTEVRTLLERLGGIACKQVAGMPRHYHYLMEIDPPQGRRRVERDLDFPALYRQATRRRFLERNRAIEVVGSLGEADCEHVADYYARRHAVLTRLDATDAGFGPDSLRRVLTDPRYAKIAYRHEGQLANLALFANVRDCPWIDQAYIRSADPERYQQGRVLIGIGAISDPIAPPRLARETLNVAGRLLAFAGANLLLGIATDDVSNRYIPRISIEALMRTGFNPHPTEAVNGVEFRALVLRSEG